MPEEFTAADGAALFTFFAIWIGYNTVFDGRFRRPSSINAQMIAVRQAWMVQLLKRENRITDSTLIGHAIRTAAFFASTTLLLLAGLVGVASSREAIHDVTTNLSMLFSRRSPDLFELEILLLIAIFVYAFFKFTWAIRQFNYFSAFIGSAPTVISSEDTASKGSVSSIDHDLAKRMGLMLTHAFWQFNAGVRAYYFALGTLGWFVHPVLFMATTITITLVLVRRQLYSATARDIAAHVDLVTQDRETDPPR